QLHGLHSFPTRRSSDLFEKDEWLPDERKDQSDERTVPLPSSPASGGARLLLSAETGSRACCLRPPGTKPPDRLPSERSDTSSARSEEHTSELQSLAYLV